MREASGVLSAGKMEPLVQWGDLPTTPSLALALPSASVLLSIPVQSSLSHFFFWGPTKGSCSFLHFQPALFSLGPLLLWSQPPSLFSL